MFMASVQKESSRSKSFDRRQMSEDRGRKTDVTGQMLEHQQVPGPF